ncbi:hypothetical protein FACS1894132_08660 [Clostridia bacterium]|nr:hypothetical protein FACS1894132_08660 [Clostridia bacterium]
MIKKSILAGVLIALAMTMYAKIGNASPYDGDVHTLMAILYKPIAAGIFAFALTYIKEQGLPLFTGKAGTDFSKKDLFLKVLPSNLLGCFIVTFPLIFTESGYEKNFQLIINGLTNDEFYAVFIKAIFCGALMRIACNSKSIYVTIGCVFAFLMSGFYHCIALSAAFFGAIGESFDGMAIPWILIAVIGNWVGAFGVSYFKCEKWTIKGKSE